MLQAVLDPEPGQLTFVLLRDGTEAENIVWPMQGRDAAGLPLLIDEELKKRDLSLEDIESWTVGSGPGSFTFLRLAAALVAGWRFSRPGLPARCVPGAVAFAAPLAPQQGETVGVLYDGRNKELLYFGVINDRGFLKASGETAVLNKDQAESFFAKKAGQRLVCSPADAVAVRALLPAGCSVTETAPDAAALVRNTDRTFDGDLTKLVYIRPAVVPKAE